MKKHLRVMAESAGLACVALSLPMLSIIASVPVYNFFGSWGIILSLLGPMGMMLCVLVPFAVAAYYGYRRELHFDLVSVWFGWLIGWLAYSAIVWVMLLRHLRLPTHKPFTPGLTDWLLWAAWTLLFPLLPALATMLGQSLRTRASHPSD